jgi:hypothetical protein
LSITAFLSYRARYKVLYQEAFRNLQLKKGDAMFARSVLVLGTVIWAFLAAEARAHFLFINIRQPAEAGRIAEIYFNDLPAAGDSKLIDKVSQTRLWLLSGSAEPREVKVHKGADRLRAILPASGTVTLIGECEYGVLARPNQAPFLLRYYPKAIAGSLKELSHLSPTHKTPVEIVGMIDNDSLQLALLRSDQPVPDVEFTILDAKQTNEKIKADSSGHITWKPKAPGRYAVYARAMTKNPGELNGQKYDEIREYATLSFNWPLERSGTDQEAVSLFDDAVAARASWKGYPGFQANINGFVDGRAFHGKLTVEPDGKIALNVDDSDAKPWLQEQLESMVLHRGGSSGGSSGSAANRPKPLIQFGEESDDNPFGRLLVVGSGKSVSSYRIKDKQILAVNRYMGKQNFTITVFENDRNPEGQFLPRSYSVQYWDAESGALKRTEALQERWQRIDKWDLPAFHLVNTSSDGGLSIRCINFADVQLLHKAASR